MTVEMAQPIGQNPAYRLIASIGNSPLQIIRKGLFSHSQFDLQSIRLIIRTTGWSPFLFLCLVSCISARTNPSPTNPSQPPPAIPAEQISQTPSTSWNITFDGASHSYRSTTKAILELDGNPTVSQDTISVVTQYTLKITDSPEPVLISGQLESTSSGSGLHIHTDSQTVTIIRIFSGTFQRASVSLSVISQPSIPPARAQARANSSLNSDSNNSALAEIHAGIVIPPKHLILGSSWTDTITSITYSQAGLPSTTQLIRLYTVASKVNHAHTLALLVKRAEAIHLTGTYVQNQHTIKYQGDGTGSAIIYLDPSTGKLLDIKANQELRITVTSSSHSQVFIQKLEQIVTLQL